MAEVDRSTEKVLQDELVRNERIVEHPELGRIRFRRPTPRQERMIADVRGKQYHKDLQNPEILSHAQLEKLAIDRNMWSEEKGERVQELSRRTGELMGILDALEYDSLDTVSEEYSATFNRLLEIFSENEEIGGAVKAYFDLEGRPVFSDRRAIMAAAPSTEVDDLLEKADGLRTQIELLRELATTRKDLNDLQMEQSRLFMDSIEARADRAEEIAQIYYCCTKENGTPIWPSFDDAWDSTPDIIEFLLTNYFYFSHGITPEFQKILEKHGFTKRVPDTEDGSESSPEHPKPSSDGELPLSEQPTSSESAAPTTSTSDSSSSSSGS